LQCNSIPVEGLNLVAARRLLPIEPQGLGRSE
jgi:hypothetical protein